MIHLLSVTSCPLLGIFQLLLMINLPASLRQINHNKDTVFLPPPKGIQLEFFKSATTAENIFAHISHFGIKISSSSTMHIKLLHNEVVY